jgi:hypothetical protein
MVGEQVISIRQEPAILRMFECVFPFDCSLGGDAGNFVSVIVAAKEGSRSLCGKRDGEERNKGSEVAGNFIRAACTKPAPGH